MTRLLAIGVLVIAGSIGNAHAATITFEDVAVAPGVNSIGGDRVSGGFTFNTLANHSHLANAAFGADNSSTYLVLDDFAGNNPTTFFQGSPFALTSIDIAEWIDASEYARTVTVTGNLVGGGTISTVLTLDGVFDGVGGSADFQTFLFGAGWGNLMSVVLSGAGSPSADDYYAIDNIGVAAAVPEPATLSLLGLGSAYLVRRRRRNRR